MKIRKALIVNGWMLAGMIIGLVIQAAFFNERIHALEQYQKEFDKAIHKYEDPKQEHVIYPTYELKFVTRQAFEDFQGRLRNNFQMIFGINIWNNREYMSLGKCFERIERLENLINKQAEYLGVEYVVHPSTEGFERKPKSQDDLTWIYTDGRADWIL